MASTGGRAAESRAKGAIYGTDSRPLTPINHGKKMVAGSNCGGGLPFATFAPGAIEGNDKWPTDFHMMEKTGSVVGKVGTQEISRDTYRHQMEMNHAIDAESRARNSGGPAPFAADYSSPAGADGGGRHPAEDCGLPANRGGREPTGKVGAPMGGFDAEVYATQRAVNLGIHEKALVNKFGAAGIDASHSAPFATSDSFDELRRREYYTAKPRRQDEAACAKPYSQQGFDAAPYSAQLRHNHDHQVQSTIRSFVGSGNILAPGS